MMTKKETTTYEDRVMQCFDAVCKRQPSLGASAAEVTEEMIEQGWLAPLDTTLDIADILQARLGRHR